MKKIFLLLFATMLLKQMWAHDFQNGDLYYNITSDSTVEVVAQSPWNDDNYIGLTTISIPDFVSNNGIKYSVTGIGEAAFYNSIELISVDIPNSVSNIRGAVFFNCTSLTSVSIPGSISNIPYRTFYNCSSLTTINIPNSVTVIGQESFSGCSKLSTITIPHSVTTIYDDAFDGCNSIKTLNYNTNVAGRFFINKTTIENINIGDSTTSISEFLFSGCSGLKNLYISHAVTSIAQNAFNGCVNIETLTYNTNAVGTYFKGRTSIKTINVGDSVTEIAENAFADCSGLITINVGKSVSSIGRDAFKNCNKIDYNVYDNAFYIGNDENPYVVLMKPKNKSITTCNINDKCKIIYYKAFEYCGLTELKIPNSIISIGSWAFYACGGLKSIVIGDSVRNIDEYTFAYCEKLKSITIPNSVKNIGDNAFMGCKSLESVVIGDSVIAIGDYSFSNCYSLTSVIIGKSVKYIGEKAFDYCSHIDPIICLSVKPAEIAGDPFPSRDTVYVPAECIETYKTATYWKRKEILPFGIVSVNSEDETMGTVLGDSILLYDSSITITAIPKEGCHFAKWSDENTDNPRVCSTANDTSFTAIFEAHTEVVDSAIGATCTTTGLTEGSHCSVCGKVLVAQNKIPMVEHTAVVDAAVAATATETGLTEGSHCSVCGKVIVAQEVIPALGEQGGGNENNPGTIVAESAAHTIHIYSYDNKIVVENATDEIRIYDAMGRIVSRDVASNVSTITVNTPGIYIVRIGNNAKRVFVNW